MSIPDRIRSNMIRQQVALHRYEAGQRAQVRKMLDQLGRELAKDIAGSGLDTPRTDWQRARLQALISQAEAKITETYGVISSKQSEQMQGLVEVSGDGVVTALNDAIGARLLQPINWTPEQLAAIADETLIEGAPSAEWWSRQGAAVRQAFADEMRQGMLRGDTVTQLRDRIMGQNIRGVNAVGKVDLRKIPQAQRGVIWAARRNAESLVRTSVISASGSAHMAAYEANADIMDGVQWMATLDNRSCIRCAAMDQKEWSMEESHPVPALHWRCRCFLMPKTKSWEQLAREAGGNTRIARELDKIPPGQRASMGGPVSGDLKYEDWFNAQSESDQLDILGPGKLGLYKRGQLGFTDMVDQSGNPYTLDQLRRNLGDPSAKGKDLEEALLSTESKTRSNKTESGHLFTPEGEKLFSKQGGVDYVAFEQNELDQFKGNILTHNHPRGSSFSPQDVGLACRWGLKEIRASGRYARYSMSEPETGWDENLWSRNIKPAVDRASKDVWDEAAAKVRRGELDPEKASIQHWDKVWTRVAKELNLDYVREEWP